MPRKASANSRKNFVGKIILVKGYIPVCTVKFWVDETQIYISDLDTHKRHRRCGYGRLIMDYMKFLAEVLQKPIILYSVDTSAKFYEKLGMECLSSAKMKRKIIIINESPDYKHTWNKADFIWIPNCLKRKKKIMVYA